MGMKCFIAALTASDAREMGRLIIYFISVVP